LGEFLENLFAGHHELRVQNEYVRGARNGHRDLRDSTEPCFRCAGPKEDVVTP
jgi:hypothetical protein